MVVQDFHPRVCMLLLRCETVEVSPVFSPRPFVDCVLLHATRFGSIRIPKVSNPKSLGFKSRHTRAF